MRERPIQFCEPMVRAILSGRKTHTRRVVKPQPPEGWDRACWFSAPVMGWTRNEAPSAEWHKVRSPYGQPGDLLWVREKWRIGAWDETRPAFALDYCDGPRKEWIDVPDPMSDDGELFNRLWQQSTDDARKAFGAKDRYEWEPGQSPCRWRPSIHMPRWASRITLEITGVRVEQLQDISEADAKAEGYPVDIIDGINYAIGAKNWYCRLWESLNGPGSWAANPWVWVVEFKRVQP